MSNIIPDWNNPALLQRNRLKPRTFFIPYPSRKDNKGNTAQVSASALCVPLNGEWDFKYYSDSRLFRLKDADGADWDKVNIPHVWQFDGYEKPIYTNVRYPFPQTPPLVPSINPAGVYRRNIVLDKIDGDIIISFWGVATAFHLYVNGTQVGYSEVSHMTAEFDITSALKAGSNEIIVVVYKWCNGSYLEDQDMFRHNGIFRDVFLTLNPNTYIYDSVVNTKAADGGYSLDITSDIIDATDGITAEYVLEHKGKQIAAKKVDAKGATAVQMFVDNPKLWSAETPNLYNLYISLKDKSGNEIYNIMHSVGCKTVEIKGNVFYFNGQPIKLKGVNKHDTSPDRGYAVTREYEYGELKKMKELNINCVRFSHYPPAPFVLEMCNELGLYVVDEADIESHGAANVQGGWDTAWANIYADSPEWYDCHFDRISRMFYRDRNHPCVVMWSMGNEAGFGQNFIKCAEWLQSVSDIPVHYERACNWEEGGYGFSVVSKMYTHSAEVKKYGEENTYTKPFYLCEYAHAMGVGPGGLKEYWEAIFAHDNLMGGCIWEWRDHAILHSDGTYTYGGDHGEYVHDGNFCVDGMMFPDGTPSPAALEVKNVYRPIISKAQGGKIILKNMQYFANFDGELLAELLRDGVTVKSEKIALDIKPQSDWEYRSDLLSAADGGGEYLLNLTYYCPDGSVRGEEQHALNEFAPYVAGVCGGKIEVEQTHTEYRINTDNGVFVFDKSHANLNDIIYKGKGIFNRTPLNGGYNYYAGATQGLMPEIYRYCIDNDRNIKNQWQDKYYNMMWVSLLDSQTTVTDTTFELRAKFSYSPPVLDGFFELEVTYTVYGSGEVKVNTVLIPLKEDLPWLPKLGLSAELKKSFDTVEWYGYGSGENYSDFLEAARVGRYSAKVKDMCPPYIRPQEGGNRSGVRQAAFINGGEGVKLNVYATKMVFNINARHYCGTDYLTATHRHKIVQKDTTQICIDGFLSGIGSNSCGPLPDQKYRIPSNQRLEYEFVLRPETV